MSLRGVVSSLQTATPRDQSVGSLSTVKEVKGQASLSPSIHWTVESYLNKTDKSLWIDTNYANEVTAELGLEPTTNQMQHLWAEKDAGSAITGFRLVSMHS